MPEDKPELSSTELIRQAREQFGPPKLETEVSTHVEGPSIQELLAVPLSSESLLPQRSVDHWAPSDEPPETPWEQVDHSDAPAPAAEVMVPKRRYVAAPGESSLAPMPLQLPTGPPAPTRTPDARRPASSRARPARRPLAPTANLSGRANPPWRLIVAGVFVFAVILGALAEDDATSTTQIELGGCYDSIDLEQASAVNCSLPHRVQLFAQIDTNPNLSGTVDQCSLEATALLNSGAIPDTTTIPQDTFVGAIGAPVSNAGNTFCYVQSASGRLVGSVLSGS